MIQLPFLPGWHISHLSLWRAALWFLPRLALMLVGVFIGAASVQLFMVPFDIAPAGMTGVSVILNELFSTPIGLFILLLNVPIMVLGYRYLGGIYIVATTLMVVVLYGIALDLITPLLPEEGVSDNVLLNALFGGVTGGISGALVLRAGATFGGTSTIAVILQRRTGTPLSTTYLYTDLGIIGVAGLVFGWESALYAMVALFISGVATDYVLEGPSIIRIVMIITMHPRAVADVILYDLERGVTEFEGTGMYTQEPRSMLFVTISRAEVRRMRELVVQVDPAAFIVIGQGHTAYGAGFRRVRQRPNDPDGRATLTDEGITME